MSHTVGSDARPFRFGYVILEVPDPAETARLLDRYFHLKVEDSAGGGKVVRGGTDHHWVQLERGTTKRLRRLAFEMASPHDLEVAAKRLSDAGVEIETGTDREHHVGDYVRFRDPDDNPIELYIAMTQMPVPVPPRLVQVRTMLHAFVTVPDIKRSYDFYSRVLGFRASDWVEQSAVFMHLANGFHHSFAMMQAPGPSQVDHLCFLTESLDDVMRIRARSMVDQVDSRADVKRHAPSGSISYYVTDTTSDLVLEACWDHMTIADSQTHQARVLPKRPESGNVWLATEDGAVTDQMDGPLADA
ncbi:VOC family protein [Nocardioides sp. LHG3406-4]|uniref:VOC family protein n=1 Tax=Nocardioides sp. LHG3406-4 TaxID=2804575 RepID=UPI003CE6C5C0